MQTIPFSEARAQLAQTLRSVEANNEPFAISRRGRVVGVVMSVDQHQRLTGKATGFAEKLQAWRSQYLPPEDAALENDPFADLRQPETARDFSW